MGLRLVHSKPEGLDEDSLAILRAKLGVIRALCAPCGHALESNIVLLEEDAALALVDLFETMLRTLSSSERREYGLYRRGYRKKVPDDILKDTLAIAMLTPGLLGVGGDRRFKDVHDAVRAKAGQSLPRRIAGLSLIRELARLCLFGIILRERKRSSPVRLVR